MFLRPLLRCLFSRISGDNQLRGWIGRPRLIAEHSDLLRQRMGSKAASLRISLAHPKAHAPPDAPGLAHFMRKTSSNPAAQAVRAAPRCMTGSINSVGKSLRSRFVPKLGQIRATFQRAISSSTYPGSNPLEAASQGISTRKAMTVEDPEVARVGYGFRLRPRLNILGGRFGGEIGE